MKVLRQRIDTSIEKRIITGMIVSKKFLDEIYSVLDFEYFSGSFIKTIATWVIEFYETYGKAPFDHIQDIFESKKEKLQDEESSLIEELLVDISNRYSYEKGINVEYLRDQTFEYFKRKELLKISTNIQYLLDKGDIVEAENEVKKFRSIQKVSTNWINPLAEETVREFFIEEDEEFFKFPGELGRFLGSFDKEWFIGIEAPFKRGKTWLLLEFAVIAMLSKISVVFFSLDDPIKMIEDRIYKRLTAYAVNIKEHGYIKYPCFDCVLNQHGECNKKERKNNTILYERGDAKPEFRPNMVYRACTWCRQFFPQDYEIATWFEAFKRPEFNRMTVPKSMKDFDEQFGNYFRLKTYPRASVNVSVIKRDLDILEQTENIVPQIIIVDYADVLGPETAGNTGVQKEDETWMSLAGLAGERHALVVTGTQVTKEGLDVNKLRLKHTARWIGKLGHVSIFLVINQDDFDKEAGIIRISILEHNYREFDENRECYVLQQLQVGQPVLDSEIKK